MSAIAADQKQAILRMDAQGFHRDVIATKLGLAVGSVAMVLYHNRKRAAAPAPPAAPAKGLPPPVPVLVPAAALREAPEVVLPPEPVTEPRTDRLIQIVLIAHACGRFSILEIAQVLGLRFETVRSWLAAWAEEKAKGKAA